MGTENGFMKAAPIVVVRGGGDLATGIVQKLSRAGFRVLVTEVPQPLAIRRTVALCEAVYTGLQRVEDITARKIADIDEAPPVWARGEVPLMVDPVCACLQTLRPDALVDAIIAKRNVGTHKGMADIVVALGPGFCAGKDAHAVIETMRGHSLGRLILDGEALANTGIPGELGGKSAERVVHAPAAGAVRHIRKIGDRVEKGETIFMIGDTPVASPLDGTLRGLITEGLVVQKGLKCADVDPRPAEDVDCSTISDKARNLGGAVLEAILYLGRQGA